ncbi:MAG: efflux RND transporter permease subunit [Planctomycetota bacterium]
MLDRIIKFSLEHRLLVVVAALGVAIYGLLTAARLPIDVLPDLNRPTVTVMTEVHDMAPEDIERQVTWPIEQAVNGVAGVTRVRSSSGMGMSVVNIELAWNAEIYRARQLVQEKLDIARARLPAGVEPTLAPLSSLLGQILIAGLTSDGNARSVDELRAHADQVIVPALLGVNGVSQVLTTGGAPRQLQVEVDADLLQAEAVTLAEVAEAIRKANRLGSGGLLSVGSEAPMISVLGLVEDAANIGAAVVRQEPGRAVRIRDVARVRFGPAAVRVGDAGVDAQEGALIIVLKQPTMDTLAVTRDVEAELGRLGATLPEGMRLVPDVFRQATFIERAVHNVGDAVKDGAWLVLIVLALFLLDLRTTFITLTAIPLSIAITALVFASAGLSINTMTLGGLAVAIGALVDDAIVDVENVFRRLRQAWRDETGVHPLRVVLEASREVRKPILVGTLIVIVVYLPLFALDGMEGRLFRPIALAYIVSVLASLLVALTVTPVLCSLLLPATARRRARKEGPLVRGLMAGAEKGIRFSLAHPRWIAVALGGFVLFGLGWLFTRGSNFLPAFDEGSAQVNLMLPPGTSLETASAWGRKLEEVVMGVPGVAHVGRRTGRAEGDEHAMDVSMTEMIVTFDPATPRNRADILADIRAHVSEAFPGLPTETEQPLAHLLSHLLSGVTAQVAIKITGTDLPTLRRLGKEVEAAVQGVPGVTDLFVEPQTLVPRVEVVPYRERLADEGLSVDDVAETVELALEGEKVSYLLQGAFSYPIVLRLRPQDRESLERIADLQLRGADDSIVRLADVADVHRGLTPSDVKREQLQRRLVVQHNVEGRALSDVVADVERALAPIRAALPSGYDIRLSGQFEAQEAAEKTIRLLSFVALALMGLLLYGHFRSLNLALQVLLNIPAAFIGAVALLAWTGQDLSVATLVGFVALGGIASRNGILLLDHYLHLLREEGVPFGPELIIRAGRERIVPVMMTALTSGIALVPLLLTPDEPGREILYPVATVLVGGLFTSTLLDVLLTPGVFHLFGRRAAEAMVRRSDDPLAGALAHPSPTTPSEEA